MCDACYEEEPPFTKEDAERLARVLDAAKREFDSWPQWKQDEIREAMGIPQTRSSQ